MPANKNAMPGPSTPKRMAVELEAKLAAMEEEEAAKVKRRQEREEKKRELAQLAEAKKAEEAIAAVAEAAWKAAASAKKAGKWKAEGPAEDEGASKRKKAQEEGNEDMDEVAWVACRKCAFFLIFFIAFPLTISVDAITNKSSACGPWVCGAGPARSASKRSRNAMHRGARWWQKTAGFPHSVRWVWHCWRG